MMRKPDKVGATVRISVKGNGKERFLNMCRTKRYPIWNIRGGSEKDICCMTMKKGDFLHCKSAIRKSGVKAAVQKKSGLPFFVRKIRARWVFALGALMAVLFLAGMMRSVWAFEFEGNSRITKEQITDYLKDSGVMIGTHITSLDYEMLEEGLREAFPEITWASVIRKGTTLIVRIREREYEEVFGRQEGSADLISRIDGTIVSMIVREGVPLVKEGDKIKAGDILVSGAVPVYDENQQIRSYHYYHAEAQIIAETVLHFEESIELAYRKKHYSEKENRRISLGAFGKSLTLGKKLRGEDVERRSDHYDLCLFQYLHLPFSVTVTREYAYETEPAYYTKEEAENILTGRLQKYLSGLSEKGVQIIAKDVKIINNGRSMQINADLTVRTDAGIGGKIPETETE